MVYVLVTFLENPKEAEALNEYRKRAKTIRAQYGVETVLRLNTDERLIGDFEEESIRILKFPSVQHVKDWLSDPRYQEIVPLREKGYSKVTLTILEEVTT